MNAQPPLSLRNFYGSFTDRDRPGYHLVDRCYQNGSETTLVEVVKVTRLEVQYRQLFCEYEILQLVVDGVVVTDAVAQRLIHGPLLGGLYYHNYAKEADRVVFINRESGARRVAQYHRNDGAIT
ncbi:MAG: hypothetical protein H7Z41_13650 [Cytophagales bacterium]|nr:hypothetical protein [Armatimonadota bacterium]